MQVESNAVTIRGGRLFHLICDVNENLASVLENAKYAAGIHKSSPSHFWELMVSRADLHHTLFIVLRAIHGIAPGF